MYGKYKHTLDAKGRLFVPAKLREELGASFYVAQGADTCLTVYTEEEWQKLLEKFASMPSSRTRHMRSFFANVHKCEPDKQGRILLPESMRNYAKIKQDVVFIGLATRAEIWSAELYEAEEAEYLTPENIAALMEELRF